jgi:hypothetical protein
MFSAVLWKIGPVVRVLGWRSAKPAPDAIFE